MPSFEDKQTAMHARHSIAKTPADISELNISCAKGVVELSGKLKRPRGFVGNFSVRKEFEIMQVSIRLVHGVKDVVADRVELLD